MQILVGDKPIEFKGKVENIANYELRQEMSKGADTEVFRIEPQDFGLLATFRAVENFVRDGDLTKEKLNKVGFEPFYNPPEQTAALLRADITKYAKIIKDAGIKAEQ